MRLGGIAVIVLLLLFVGVIAAAIFYQPGKVETVMVTVTKTSTTTKTITEAGTKVLRIGAEILDVCFSAVENCADRLAAWIRRANKSIYVMVYSFTKDELGEALVDAVEKGVDVEVVFEENQVSEYSELWRLKDAGAKVYLDGNRYLMHHKVAVIDGIIVVTGSYNWSRSAEERNDENLIILRDEWLAQLYEREFERVKGEASAV